ncbi:DUF6308 family protein [Streptomyces sp. NPDC058486]|uniref:DUF6308 family protein n=1 Tax=unclassified Streptomyces TaxID=2593676 RepID=UPI003654BDB3
MPKATPPHPTPATLTTLLQAHLTAPRAIKDLRDYFATYTGRHFEHLAGGGDRPETAHRITAEDLIAVQTLSVTVPTAVALDILEGPLGTRLSDLLRAIPVDKDMADAEPTDLSGGSPAHQAWHLLVAQPKVGPVIAGKLLARKRPRLLPVYDKVVRCALGSPTPSFWLALHTALRADDHTLHHQLLALRQSAELPDTISALRVCDVAVWMGHRAEKHACPR